MLDGAGTATILYTDIVGSTQMRARLGDVEADLVRRRHDEILCAVVAKHGGSVVKGLGDGILAAFNATTEAVTVAREIQRSIDRANRHARDDRRIEVRVGISAGDVSWESGDCHGTPVVTAARLCDSANGGQILCDDLVRGLARGRTELGFVLVGETKLRGLPEPVVTFEVPWTATAIELRLLGRLEVLVDGRPIALAGAKQRAVLAMLALNAGEVVPTDRLLDHIWGDATRGARRSLQVYVSNLRKLLVDAAEITSLNDGYVLEIRPEQLDFRRFTELAQKAAPRWYSAN